MIMIRFAVLTISDKGFQGKREDLSGRAIEEMLGEGPYELLAYRIVPDEREIIAQALRQLADEERADLVLTTGGTGLSPRDVTPEATRDVVEREVPGVAEAMRAESFKKTPFGMLSRGVVGLRGKTLIVNLPGSPKAVRENLAVILPVLSHAIEKTQGDLSECGGSIQMEKRGKHVEG